VRKLFLILCTLMMACTHMHAIILTDTIPSADSTKVKKKFSLDNILKWPVIGVIYPSLSPETGIAIGLGLQGTWHMAKVDKPSFIRLTGCYTQYNQWKLQSTGALYFGGTTPWMLQFSLQYRDYPDYFYGIGNEPDFAPIGYDSKRFNTTIEPLFPLPKNWSLGPIVDFLWEKTNLNDSILTGNFNTLMWGMGISSLYDTRKGMYYPTKGMYFKFKGFYCEPKLGSTCRTFTLDADYRHFITLCSPKKYDNEFQRVNGSLIFAYQVRLQTVLTDGNNDDIPFQMLPTLGGDELLRGIRANMFRDNTLWAVQTELRFPIYRIIHGTAFAGVGDVYNTQAWHWTTPKVGYGLGLRATINRNHVNLRFDVARNNLDQSWSDISSYSFYITASEAF